MNEAQPAVVSERRGPVALLTLNRPRGAEFL